VEASLIPSLRRTLIAAIVPLLIAAVVAPVAAADDSDRLDLLGDEYVARWLARAPHEATRLGVHNADAVLLPVTRTTLAEDLVWLRGFRDRLASIGELNFTPDRAIERALLAGRVERQLLDLEVLRPFERDPSAYLPLIVGSVESVLERPIASPCQRLRFAAQRLARVPEVLRAARINLTDPPPELIAIAVDRYAGALRFYRETVPSLAPGCRDARTQADLAQADTTAVRAVEAFLLYLREDLLPTARGRLAIGPDGCRRLLRVELLEDTRGAAATDPIDSLLARASRLVDERRAALDALAQGGARAALDVLAIERPDALGLVWYAEQQLAVVRDFLRGHGIVTLPERDALAVREARPFRSPLSLTGLDAPGAREPRATEAWLEVTPPDSTWDEGRREVHLTHFDRQNTALSVMHEGMPGRFLRGIVLRGMVLRGQPARLRQALQSTWPAEDWGEYCEQMMVDEGFGADDPGYRLTAAARALRFAGRSYAALALHAGAISTDQARRMLEERCLLDPDEAARETRRAAADPAAMGYTSGARRLLELRDEARRALGPRFSIRVFNDAVLRYGASPAGIVQAGVRRELGVGDDGTPAGAKP
jgi:uncharacterized protein DUF885